MPDTTHIPQPHDVESADSMDDTPALDSYVSAKVDAWTAAIDEPGTAGDPAEE